VQASLDASEDGSDDDSSAADATDRSDERDPATTDREGGS
jgi:multicomponent Na+:H+ antiporter subunit C